MKTWHVLFAVLVIGISGFLGSIADRLRGR